MNRLVNTFGLLACCLWAAASASAETQQAGDVQDEAHFEYVCEDAGAGDYEAFPDLCRLPDGRLMCVFYAGYGHVALPNEEYPKGGRISYCTSVDDGKTWSEPKVLYDGPHDDRDPSITALSNGKLICNFFSLRRPESGEESDRGFLGMGSWIITSDDYGQTWSEPKQIVEDYYCSSPVRELSDGRLILGIYYQEGDESWGAVIYSDDQGETWSDPVDIDNAGRRLDAETDVIELENGDLYAAQRARSGSMAYSISTDRGESWSVSEEIGFPGHCPYLHRTMDGIIVLAHRLPQTSLHYSINETKTWSENVIVSQAGGAYPSMVNRRDGSVLIAYYDEGLHEPIEGGKVRQSNIRVKRFSVSESGVEWLPIEPGPASHAVLDSERKTGEPFKAILDACAWPNLTKLPNGDIAAIIFNKPSHGQVEGDVECWVSPDDGENWLYRGIVTQHEPDTVRMNVAAGLAPNGDLLVVCSGWSDHAPEGGERYGSAPMRGQIIDAWVCRSSDGGRTWNVKKEFPRTPEDRVLIPFGDILEGPDGDLVMSAYCAADGSWITYSLRSEDGGETWGDLVKIADEYNETTPLHLGDGNWLAAARLNGLNLYASSDNAQSWRLAAPNITGSGQHPGHLLELEDGSVLLTYGDRQSDHLGVCGRISHDGGTTWGPEFDLAEMPRTDGGYPSSVQREDGKIVTAFYSQFTKEGEDQRRYYMGAVIWDPKTPPENPKASQVARLEDPELDEPFLAINHACAWPNLTTLPNGDIVATIFNQPSHGLQEGDLESWATTDGGETWAYRGTPAAHEPDTARFNTAVGLDGEDNLTVLASGWSDKAAPGEEPYMESYLRKQILDPWVSKSSDGGKTWEVQKSFPKSPDGNAFISFGDVFHTDDGALCASAYTVRPSKSFFLRSNDGGETWEEPVLIAPGIVETTLLPLGDDTWLAASRASSIKLYRSEDDGQSWELLNSSATEGRQIPGHLQQLEDGRIVLTYGDRREGHFGIGARISSDGGQTWGEPVRLADTPSWDCGYPSTVERPDGTLLTAYYTNTEGGEDYEGNYAMYTVLWTPPEN